MPSIDQSRLSEYAATDWNTIDYEMWRPADINIALRGPEPTTLEEKKYIVAIGAAQTFGRFCPKPYPTLLSERLGIPVVNLGFAGAGPRLFHRQHILEIINRSALAIVQVLSGRSLANSVFECPNDGGTLRRRGRGMDVRPQFALDAWGDWMNELTTTTNGDNELKINTIRSLVEETRTLWVGEMVLLRSAIKRPCILLWFSKREMDYTEQYTNPDRVFGEFPQLINRRAINAIEPLFQGLVEAISSRGLPQPLFNRFNGEPHCLDAGFMKPFHNVYYPSPEMQQDAADALAPTVARLLANLAFPLAGSEEDRILRNEPSRERATPLALG